MVEAYWNIEAIEMADDNFTFFLSDKNNISFKFYIYF